MVVGAATTSNANRVFFIDSAYSQKTATTSTATATANDGPYIGVNVNGLATSRSEAKTSSPSISPNYYDDVLE